MTRTRSVLAHVALAGTSSVLTLLAVELLSALLVPRRQFTRSELHQDDQVGRALQTLEDHPDINPVPTISDPVLLWRNKPLATKTQPINPKVFGHDGTWTVRINASGYRGREQEFPGKADGAYRVLCVGDSITFGFNVDQEATFANRLEAILRERHPGRQIDVINAAVPGWSWLQGLRFLQVEGLGLHPNLVIEGHGTNDFFFLVKVTDAERLGTRTSANSWREWIVRLLRDTNTYRAFQRLLPPSAELGELSPACQRQLQQTPDGCRRVSLPEIRAAVRDAKETAASAGSELVVINVDFMRTLAIEATRDSVAREHVPFLDFVTRFEALKDETEAERARKLGLSSGGTTGPQPGPGGALPTGPPGTVVLRVEALKPGATMTVRNQNRLGPPFEFEERLYDDGTHGDEVPDDGVSTVTVAVPAGVTALNYVYSQDGELEFTPLPPLPAAAGYRVLRVEGDTMGPVDLFGDLFLMAEQTHPNARGHQVIAASLAEQVERTPSFQAFLRVTPAAKGGAQASEADRAPHAGGADRHPPPGEGSRHPHAHGHTRLGALRGSAPAGGGGGRAAPVTRGATGFTSASHRRA